MSLLKQISSDDLSRFEQSLERIGTEDKFYQEFYERLFAKSEEIGRIFHNRDIPAIIAKLRITLSMVAEAAQAKPGLEMYLDMLGAIHRRLDVGPHFFELWREALIETVSENDPWFNAEIRGSWERVIDKVIGCMQPESDQD